MRHMIQPMRWLAWLTTVTLLLAACQPVTLQPMEAPQAAAPSPAVPLETQMFGPCEAIPNQVLVLGIEDRFNEIIASLDIGTYEVVETFPMTGLEAEEFDMLYVIETEEPDAFAQQLREAEISASLNYASHLFGHSGGDSPFGRSPHRIMTPPAGGINGQRALSETLQIHQADTESPIDVVVGVFDTAPYDTADASTLAGDILASPGSAGLPHDGESSDHGIFVSSLVRAVAPDATVLLYKVLDDNGAGTTLRILKQVANFLIQYPPSVETPRVLNFSLGIWCHEPLPGSDEEAPLEFAVLNLLLQWAANRGVVIVAAAGNNSNRYEDFVLESEYPASAPFSIGVGATNNASDITCYSHDADVFAPGGDGIEETVIPPSTPSIPPGASTYCAPNHTMCEDENCDYGLLGLSARSSSGYAYWSGTSFATPLVSGLAARLLASGEDPLFIQERILDCAAPNSAGEHILGSIVSC